MRFLSLLKEFVDDLSMYYPTDKSLGMYKRALERAIDPKLPPEKKLDPKLVSEGLREFMLTYYTLLYSDSAFKYLPPNCKILIGKKKGKDEISIPIGKIIAGQKSNFPFIIGVRKTLVIILNELVLSSDDEDIKKSFKGYITAYDELEKKQQAIDNSDLDQEDLDFFKKMIPGMPGMPAGEEGSGTSPAELLAGLGKHMAATTMDINTPIDEKLDAVGRGFMEWIKTPTMMEMFKNLDASFNGAGEKTPEELQAQGQAMMAQFAQMAGGGAGGIPGNFQMPPGFPGFPGMPPAGTTGAPTEPSPAPTKGKGKKAPAKKK